MWVTNLFCVLVRWRSGGAGGNLGVGEIQGEGAGRLTYVLMVAEERANREGGE